MPKKNLGENSKATAAKARKAAAAADVKAKKDKVKLRTGWDRALRNGTLCVG